MVENNANKNEFNESFSFRYWYISTFLNENRLSASRIKVHSEGSSERLFDSIQEMATFSEYRYPVKNQEISKIQFFKDQARQNDVLA